MNRIFVSPELILVSTLLPDFCYKDDPAVAIPTGVINPARRPLQDVTLSRDLYSWLSPDSYEALRFVCP
jgi:hypothetical protein